MPIEVTKVRSMINNYNPEFFKLWEGNMDIQRCGSNEAIALYITKFMSKSEPTELNISIVQVIHHIQRDLQDHANTEGATSLII